jgi:hypothetical protein
MGAAMRHTLTLPLTIAALAVLAACSQAKDETVNETIGDPMEQELANAPKVELPPPLKASKTYRCKDNSLIFVDFFEGGKLANLRTAKEGPAIQLKAEEDGKPLTDGAGHTVEGSGGTITYNGQSCKS